MKINISNKMIFGFEPPNLSFLGSQDDFKKLSELIVDLTDTTRSRSIVLVNIPFFQFEGEVRKIKFYSDQKANDLAVLNNEGDIVFNLDPRNWERLFKYFVLMSWYKRTYYLNAYEESLEDLSLKQDLNFICSSEF